MGIFNILKQLIKEKNRQLSIFFFLVLFIVLFIIQNYIFIIQDSAPQFSDGQFLNSIMYYNNMIKGIKFFDLKILPYPPALYLFSILAYKLTGVSMESARISLSFFSVIFLLSMFGIEYRLGNIYSGFTVMSIAASSPHILNNSRCFFLDFPQTAITALAFYLLLSSDCYKKTLYSTLFGIVLSVSFLIKWSTAFYMFIPVVWFLLPLILKNKKTKILFSIFLSCFILSFIGMAWYWKNLEKYRLFDNWLVYYLLFIVTPGLLYFIVLKLLKKKWKPVDEGETEDLNIKGIINFSKSIYLFLFLTTPWYLWASKAIKTHYLWINTFLQDSANRSYLHTFTILKTMYNFIPVFLIMGIIYLFAIKKERYTRLLLIANILLIFLLTLRFAYPEPRYFLPAIIFLAALGGYWVAFTGKLKPYLTAFIIIISMISILAWTGIPWNSRLYYSIPRYVPDSRLIQYKLPFKLLASQGPDSTYYNMAEVLDRISPVDEGFAKPTLIIYVNKPVAGIPFETEFIKWEASRKSRRIEPILVLSRHKKELQEKLMEIKLKEKQRFFDIKEILIVHKKTDPATYVNETIKETFPDILITTEKIEIEEKWNITVIQLYEDK